MALQMSSKESEQNQQNGIYDKDVDIEGECDGDSSVDEERNDLSAESSTKLLKTTESKPSQVTETEAEMKKKKRLELNRKAAKESRERKKKRIEALNQNIVMLIRENFELRTHNEELRELIQSGSHENDEAMDQFQSDNATLRLALYECVENLVHARFPKSASLFLAPGAIDIKQEKQREK
mmetsp:Transcript_14199/g.20069  ORF Transcript_14199/g.20069 Transcript_14199/m.20069 type:complete len:181 (+) Transcript_14199:34-576(+)